MQLTLNSSITTLLGEVSFVNADYCVKSFDDMTNVIRMCVWLGESRLDKNYVSRRTMTLSQASDWDTLSAAWSILEAAKKQYMAELPVWSTAAMVSATVENIEEIVVLQWQIRCWMDKVWEAESNLRASALNKLLSMEAWI